MPITAILFRCDRCGLVKAVEVDPTFGDRRVYRPGTDCICGDYSWTRIKEVI